MQTSTIYTIGTALKRAGESNQSVHILIEGHWLSGEVKGVDGYGLVLVSPNNEHSIVRLEAISAVRIPGSMDDHEINMAEHAAAADRAAAEQAKAELEAEEHAAAVIAAEAESKGSWAFSMPGPKSTKS
jgi:hypothetical protein